LVFNTALSDLSSDIESSSLSSPALPGQLNLLPSEAVPKKPDGLRWLSSRQAVEVASKRGCSRNLSGFTKWAARHPDQCLETYGLRRLQAIRGNTTIPAFEDLRYDCQDF
jgi:hypothetical protein